jgi:hypothetical protein
VTASQQVKAPRIDAGLECQESGRAQTQPRDGYGRAAADGQPDAGRPSDGAKAQAIRKFRLWVRHLCAGAAYDRLSLMDKAAYLDFVARSSASARKSQA